MSVDVAGARAPCPHCGDEHSASVLKCPKTDLVLPLEGRVLAGRFRLVRELGRGGMAEVWLALNTAVDRLVAIKLIRPEVVKRKETVARFRSEARAAGRIEHPNICQIHDFGDSPIGPFMVMEYLRGKSLASLLSGSRKLEVGATAVIVSQALAGLAAAHREGIVHRDLKPENVFLHVPENGPAAVKLMDFGVSKLTDGSGEIQTEHGALLGTPEFMAPEQVGGAAAVDGRCDLWAVGAILYRALTGKLPFKGPTIAATLLELTNSEPQPIRSLAPHVPAALCEAVMRCMAKEREQRPTDAESFAVELEPFLTEVDLSKVLADPDAFTYVPSKEDLADVEAESARRAVDPSVIETVDAPEDEADEPAAVALGEGGAGDSGERQTLTRRAEDRDTKKFTPVKTDVTTLIRGVEEAKAETEAEAEAKPDPEPAKASVSGAELGTAADDVAALLPPPKPGAKGNKRKSKGASKSDRVVSGPSSSPEVAAGFVSRKSGVGDDEHDEDENTTVRRPAEPAGSSMWMWVAVAAVLGVGAWYFFFRTPTVEPREGAVVARAGGDTSEQPEPAAEDDGAAAGDSEASIDGGLTGGTTGSGVATGDGTTTAAMGTGAAAGDDVLVIDDDGGSGALDGGTTEAWDDDEDDDGDDDGADDGADDGSPAKTSGGGHRPSGSGGDGSNDGDDGEGPPPPDPGGTFRVGMFLVLKQPGPTSTHSEARKYCSRLAKQRHVGVSNWKLPNPAVAKQISRTTQLRKGKYWTSARHNGRAKVLVAGKTELASEDVEKRRIKALCIAKQPRPGD